MQCSNVFKVNIENIQMVKVIFMEIIPAKFEIAMENEQIICESGAHSK